MTEKRKGLAILLGLKPREDGEKEKAEDNSKERSAAGKNLLSAIKQDDPEGVAQAICDIVDLS